MTEFETATPVRFDYPVIEEGVGSVNKPVGWVFPSGAIAVVKFESTLWAPANVQVRSPVVQLAHEVAAYKISQTLGWDLVPPTTMRVWVTGGQSQLVSLQLFIGGEHKHPHDADRDQLIRAGVFDTIIGQRDRDNWRNWKVIDGGAGPDHLVLFDNSLAFGYPVGLNKGSALTRLTEHMTHTVTLPDDMPTRLAVAVDGLLPVHEVDALEVRAKAFTRVGRASQLTLEGR